MAFDPVQAFNLLLERIDKLVTVLDDLVAVLEEIAKKLDVVRPIR